MLLVYAWVIFILDVGALFYFVGREDNDRIGRCIARLLIYTPIFGRVLQWW
jgi:hypothetical protein